MLRHFYTVIYINTPLNMNTRFWKRANKLFSSLRIFMTSSVCFWQRLEVLEFNVVWFAPLFRLLKQVSVVTRIATYKRQAVGTKWLASHWGRYQFVCLFFVFLRNSHIHYAFFIQQLVQDLSLNETINLNQSLNITIYFWSCFLRFVKILHIFYFNVFVQTKPGKNVVVDGFF